MSNDMTIIGIGIALFLGLGFAIPYINAEFGTTHTELNPDSLTSKVTSDAGDNVTGFEVLKSVLTIWIWSIAGIPIWLNLLLWIPRAIVYITIARNIWWGGGA